MAVKEYQEDTEKTFPSRNPALSELALPDEVLSRFRTGNFVYTFDSNEVQKFQNGLVAVSKRMRSCKSLRDEFVGIYNNGNVVVLKSVDQSIMKLLTKPSK